MHLSSLLALVGSVGLSVVVGCASAPGQEEGATQEGAATSAAKIQSGVYDGELTIVAKGAAVEGTYSAQIGDPAHGGATCSFTFAGFLETVGGVEHGQITATDGYDVVGGELVAEAGGGVHARLNNTLNACLRVAPVLSEEGVSYGGREAIAADVAGYRSVKADKAFFYDRAGGDPRAAYVITGDTVQITGPEQSGFYPARYRATKGFLRSSDLQAPFAPVPNDTLRAKYEIAENESLASGFEVITSHDRDMFFNLTAVRKTGGMNMGDIVQGHAPIIGDTAVWTGDGCTIKFAFSSDAKTVQVAQENACGDFGAFVYVSGTYHRQ